MRAVAASLVGAALLLSAEAARACAVCAAGDPTLYAMGSEGTFAGRVRGSLGLRVGDAWVGEPGIDALTIKEKRLDMAVVWAPLRDLSFSADVPLLDRTIRLDHVGETSAFAPGDVDIRVRDVVLSSHEGSVRQSLAFHAGVELPSGPVERDLRGALLPPDLQPGCNSLVTLAGASYGWSRAPFTFNAAATLLVGLDVRSDAPHAGDSIRTQTTFQVQPKPWIAGRLGFDTKFEEPGTMPGDKIAKDSGGIAGYATSELSLVPRTDWVISVGGYFPVLQAFRGKHGEGPVASVSLILDF